MLYRLVNEVINGYEVESDSDSDSVIEEIDFLKPKKYFPARFDYTEFEVNENPLTQVNVIEIEKNENLDNPFEIKFPTLVYFFYDKT